MAPPRAAPVGGTGGSRGPSEPRYPSAERAAPAIASAPIP
jgi:hypothetical protein